MTRNADAIALFSAYMKLAGVASLDDEPCENPGLRGKKLGLINGSAWIQLWSYYFGRRYLPGVKLVNAGSEAVQLSFMQAHRNGEPCPPQSNVDVFTNCARELAELVKVDAIMITCSTMNRSADTVRAAMAQYGIPVIQIDEPMMQKAVAYGGTTLIIATHGPTVENTKKLLMETASNMQAASPAFEEATVEDAFTCLGQGDVMQHNEIIARTIRNVTAKQRIDSVVLAQLSMSVLELTHPADSFGIPVLTSGREGFIRAGEVIQKR